MSDLTKWPRLLVAGDPVTAERANDILIRTNMPYMIGNDDQWGRLVCAEFGIPVDHRGRADWNIEKQIYGQLGLLDLHYLHNEQIMSSWIGGPHGWCDWGGRIGCSTYNIGKWPTRDEVQEDLDAIAAAWPFLRMDVQLVADEGDGDLAAMWQVGDGRAVYVEPGDALFMGEVNESSILQRLMPGGERGVSLDRLRHAIAQVRASRKAGGDSDV